MAEASVREWHDRQMQEHRQRVLQRIEMGTKSTSPHRLAVRLSDPLKYSNPLPDNSSGSKSRPFMAARDDSGRPTADQLVYMRQHEMQGGAIRDFQIAQRLLNRRREGYLEQEALKEGLPPAPAAPEVLTDLESQELELDILIRSIGDAVEANNFDALSLSEIKNVPRLLIRLAPYMDDSRATQIVAYLDSVVHELNALAGRNIQNQAKQAAIQRIKLSLESFVKFLEEGVLPYVNRSPQERALGANDLAKKLFDLKPGELKQATAASARPIVEQIAEFRGKIERAETHQQLRNLKKSNSALLTDAAPKQIREATPLADVKAALVAALRRA